MSEDEASGHDRARLIEPIARELPMEYALETLNKLIELVDGRTRLDMTDTVENTQRTMILAWARRARSSPSHRTHTRAGGRERNAAEQLARRSPPAPSSCPTSPRSRGARRTGASPRSSAWAGCTRLEGDDARLTGAAPAVTVAEQAGVMVATVARDDARVGSVLTPDDRVSAAAWNSVSEATVVTISGEVAEPVRIDVVGSSSDLAAMHLTVLVEENAQADAS